MRFLHDNKVMGAVLTPSSENANYPASNLKDPRLSRHLRFTSDEGEWLLVDSGGLLGHLPGYRQPARGLGRPDAVAHCRRDTDSVWLVLRWF